VQTANDEHMDDGQMQDQQFEIYLKRFHPIVPEPVRAITFGHASRRSVSVGAWSAAVAAIVVVGTVMLHVRSNRVVVPNAAHDVAFVERYAPPGQLTMRSGNAWLSSAPSFKTAVDELAFSQPRPLLQGKQSAVAVLGKEKIRL
jgi:hypothetical protein